MRKYLKWFLASFLAIVYACGGASVYEAPMPNIVRSYNPAGVTAGDIYDDQEMYRHVGLIASGPPFSFVGSSAFFATLSPDTTLVVVSISLPNRGLTFSHEGNSYEAIYGVTLVLKRDGIEVGHTDDLDTVRINSLQETSRTDESVLFRHIFHLSPGEYAVAYTIRDGTAGRDVTQNGGLIVPRFIGTSISRPVVIYGGSPRTKLTEVPQYIPKPRASAVLGIAQSVSVYLESYGTSITTPLLLTLRNAEDLAIWHDTAWLAQRRGFASGIASVPLDHADVGTLMLSVVRLGGADTIWTPIFVQFNSDLPQISFEVMLDYLQFFTTLDWLQRLRKAPLEARGTVWTAFLKATDSLPNTPQNEGLVEYFERIRIANIQFRQDTSQNHGWLSDRGSVFVGLGEPDKVYEQNGYNDTFPSTPSNHAKLLIWEYRELQARIIFYDAANVGQWRLLPSSATLFRALLARKLAG